MMTFARLNKTLAILMSAMLLGACGGDKAPATETKADTTPAQPAPTEVLRVATEGAFPPYNYTNADGSLGGFDIDIAHGICEKMQVKCDIKAQDWDGIIPSLKMGKYDAIIAAMAITEERKSQVDFSNPYYSSPIVFIAKKDSAFNPKNQADIENNIISSQRGTTSGQWLESNYPKAKLQWQESINNAFLDLSAGRSGALLTDKFTALDWLKTEAGKDFEVKGDEISFDDFIAVAINKDNPELLKKINDAIDAMKADGTYDAIVKKHNF